MQMHKDEIKLDLAQVEQMVRLQFPQWADQPILELDSYGTTNSIYRLGETYSIRIPKIQKGVGQIEKEFRWLPYLAERLTVEIPTAVATGYCPEIYPWKWAVHKWIEGESANREILPATKAIETLATFIHEIRALDKPKGLDPGAQNAFRGEPLKNRDKLTRETILKLRDHFDATILERVWDEALAHPANQADMNWLHGDLQAGNFLAKGGELVAIIDFGLLGYGDSAVDLIPAWNFFSAIERLHFKSALSISEATWKRARGWALTVAAVALEYYMHTNPGLSKISSYSLGEIEKEFL